MKVVKLCYKSIFAGQSINVVQKIKSIKEEISKYNVSLFKLQTQNAIEVLSSDSAINTLKWIIILFPMNNLMIKIR